MQTKITKGDQGIILLKILKTKGVPGDKIFWNSLKNRGAVVKNQRRDQDKISSFQFFQRGLPRTLTLGKHAYNIF
jgi:hypothetical protein